MWVTADQLRSQLDERTVLVSVFLGAFPDERLAVHVQALTRDSHELAVIPLEIPSSLVMLEHSGIKLTHRRSAYSSPTCVGGSKKIRCSTRLTARPATSLAQWLPEFSAGSPGVSRIGTRPDWIIWWSGPMDPCTTCRGICSTAPPRSGL